MSTTAEQVGMPKLAEKMAARDAEKNETVALKAQLALSNLKETAERLEHS